jgi:hypothetical protein
MAENVQTTPHLLRVHGMTLILGLIVQYILGMFTNLFVQFPDTTIPAKLWEFAWAQVSEASHIILGLLLFIGTLVLLIRALAYKNRTWTVAASDSLRASVCEHRFSRHAGGHLRRRQFHPISK